MGDDPAYDGLSKRPSMQASLNQHGTELARARQGDGDVCCYHWFEYCSGRPLLESASSPPRVAASCETQSFHGDPMPPCAAVETLEPPMRESLRDRWLADAAAEHASIAAFARQTLELVALGAPADLLADSQRASLEEIEHASACYAMARRFDPQGRSLGPGPLSTPGVRPSAWAQLVADTFVEGCVAETIAALRAERALRDCTDEPTRALLSRIADDESRHAALAWRTVAWALRSGGETAKHALLAAAHEFARGLPAATAASPDHDDRLRAFGILDRSAERRVWIDGWTEIVEPMLRALVGPRSRDADQGSSTCSVSSVSSA